MHVTEAEQKPDFKLTPYLTLTGKPLGAYCKYFGKYSQVLL